MSRNTDDIVIRLPRDAYDDLAALASQSERLDAVADCVARCGVSADNPTVIGCLVQEGGFSEAGARHLLHGLLNLHYLRQDMEISGDQILQVVTRTLEKDATEEWRRANLDAWRASQPKLVEALSERNPVGMLGKARRLQYAHEHLLRSTRVLTDLRPVFDDDADEILGGIVTHSLIVEYTEAKTRRRIHFALDTEDVLRLKLQCERAESKAATTEAVLKSMWGHRKQEGASDER